VWWDSRWELWVWGCEGHELLICAIRSLAALRLARRRPCVQRCTQRVAQAGPDDRRLAYVHSLIIIALSSSLLRRTPPPRAPLSTKSTFRSVALAWPSTPRAPPAASPPTASLPWLRRVLEPPSSPRRYPGPRLVLSQPFSRLSRRRDACLKLSSFEGHPRHMPPRDILRLLRCFWCVCLTMA